ncbi:gamma-glutamyl-gamma-aminobutyrate hydrolase family protein [Massilia solisilvae]|uniref:Gamma-glutamyl-gamma-aminobutyrate hydrolase family protein n=1 Tax=Massilia solisilvae TaxID=1811225 RepID=A0ABT2BLC1_9BURK|nr:gamma-glutamyl-gamma-aminobutyrate hydrolase family protein [Massilia solisilvae]MCS0609277.1 gamma-glutamyl-gamma-aminobutyrate hydrolase family protein [Massilia solisilvae]
MRPIVIVPACTRDFGEHPYHAAQYKYVDAVVLGADCAPMILPSLGAALDLETVLGLCDGIMLTGSASNVHPSFYSEELIDPSLPQDLARDETTLPLIRAAVARGVPIIAICRGFQEMNVALGGSLHQAVQTVEGKMDHRENPALGLDEQYGDAHKVQLAPGGMLERLLGVAEIPVNSLHGQGVNELASGLVVEATAEDGLVEAFSVRTAPGFTLALQWHPEWRITHNPYSMKMFGAFGQACREYQAQRRSRP